LIESNGYRLHHCEFSRTGEYFLLTTRDHASTGSFEGNIIPGGDTMKPIGDRLKGIVKVRGCFRFAFGRLSRDNLVLGIVDARLEKSRFFLILFKAVARLRLFMCCKFLGFRAKKLWLIQRVGWCCFNLFLLCLLEDHGSLTASAPASLAHPLYRQVQSSTFFRLLHQKLFFFSKQPLRKATHHLHVGESKELANVLAQRRFKRGAKVYTTVAPKD
jgi:hypothetical protein